MTQGKEVNVAVVGCGYWGPNLVRNFNGLDTCRVKTVCDASAERRAHMQSLYPGLEATDNFDDVLNDPDIGAVAIATPVRHHFELAKRTLEAGMHAFIEKPMAASVAECDELIAIAKKGDLTLMVGHTFIYSSPVRKIKEIIDAGELGEILYISSRRLNLGLIQKDINVTWDLAPHDISILFYIMSEEPDSLSCQGKAHVDPAVEDVTNLSLNFPGSGFSTIQSSWLHPTKTREMVFVGSKRMLVYDDVEPMEKIKIYDTRVEAPPHYDTFAEFHYSYHHGDMYAPAIRQSEPLSVECGHFIDCLRTGTKPLTSGVEGRQVVQVLESASESLKQGGATISLNG